MNRVTLGPFEWHARRRAVFLAGDRRAATLEALQQTTHVGRGTDAGQHMHVRPDHPDLENPGRLLGGDPPEETAQKASQTDIDQGLAMTGSPNDVAIDAVDHRSNLTTTPGSDRHRISAAWARFQRKARPTSLDKLAARIG